MHVLPMEQLCRHQSSGFSNLVATDSLSVGNGRVREKTTCGHALATQVICFVGLASILDKAKTAVNCLSCLTQILQFGVRTFNIKLNYTQILQLIATFYFTIS